MATEGARVYPQGFLGDLAVPQSGEHPKIACYWMCNLATGRYLVSDHSPKNSKWRTVPDYRDLDRRLCVGK